MERNGVTYPGVILKQCHGDDEVVLQFQFPLDDVLALFLYIYTNTTKLQQYYISNTIFSSHLHFYYLQIVTNCVIVMII